MKISNLLMLCVFALLATGLQAQQSQIKYADKLYDEFDFEAAAKYYEKAINKAPNNSYALGRLGDCYRLLENWEQAEIWYAQIADKEGVEPKYILHYAQALRINEKYEEATPYFEAYADAAEDPAGDQIANKMDDLDVLLLDQPGCTVELLDINTKDMDFGPAIMDNGELVFSSNRMEGGSVKRVDVWSGEPFLQLFKSSKKGDELTDLGQPEVYKSNPPNGKFHDGPVTFDPLNGTMYLSRNNYTTGKAEKDAEETVNIQLYTIKKNEQTGEYDGEIKPFAYNNKQFQVGHASISPDGQYLYFASDMPGYDSYGGTDLFVCKRSSGGWGEPMNLGPTINTSGNELYPFVAADGLLYFASDMLYGLGGLDIYVSKQRKNGSWHEPKNLGAPINTNRDDFGIVLNETSQQGYFTSNRSGGFGSDDIYAVNLQQKDFYDIQLVVTVIDAKTKDSLANAQVTIEHPKTGEAFEAITNENGQVYLPIEPEMDYKLIAAKELDSDVERYLTNSTTLSTVGVEVPAKLSATIELRREEIGVAIKIENIYYDLDKYNIRPDAAKELDKLVKLMQDNPTMEIELSSHTDCRSSDDYNMWLSAKRAEAAVNYIIYKGIPAKRIIAVGYGESILKNGCDCSSGKAPLYGCTEEDHQQNRRTEFKILKF